MTPPAVDETHKPASLMSIDKAAAERAQPDVDVRLFLWSVVAVLSAMLYVAHAMAID